MAGPACQNIVHRHDPPRKNEKDRHVKEIIDASHHLQHIGQKHAEHDHRNEPGPFEEPAAVRLHDAQAASGDRECEPDVQEHHRHAKAGANLQKQIVAVWELDRKLSEADQEHANDLERQRKRYQSQINELEEKLKNTKTMIETVEVPATAEVFEAYCAVVKNAYAMLLNYVKNAGVTKDFTKEISKMIDSFDDELCEIM